MTLPNLPNYSPRPSSGPAEDTVDCAKPICSSSKLYEDTTADIILSSAGVQHDVAAAAAHLKTDPLWLAIADMFDLSELEYIEERPPGRLLSESMAQSKMAFVAEATTMLGYAVGGASTQLRARYAEAINHVFAELPSSQPPPSSLSLQPLQLPSTSKPKKRTNLSTDAKRLLRTWFDANFHHPYPTEEEKDRFRREGGITMDQVNNWFINTRVREWKPKLHKILTDSNTAVLDEMLVKVKAPYQTHEFI
ncbi:hypothetical protein DYB34_000955 [Aphanomyces astaci]|uniref:Homeobox domain-containing protein n=1 Tax=Aphanomyces astaci TaxID=112090 RepID=A0A418C0H0_APHAT|nr:hypothetical protein DYB34_000955 [Aphanomyces astaci]